MNRFYKFVDWFAVLVGVVAVIVSQVVGTWAFSMFPLEIVGVGYELLFSLMVGLIAYAIFSIVIGVKMTVFLALTFSILLSLTKALVIASGFFGVEMTYIVLGISGGLTSLLFGMVFGGYLALRGHKKLHVSMNPKSRRHRR